ncbi:GNAT family N-acetyltransferase [Streptomyces cellulosae]|jgi:predicted acetyltransferase|uniref:Acetyltransferase n=1 Tax=Streptomyces thermodiastaticus TaxID=44061 RepID=A0ABU0KQF1_9ACTN|nr:GNAT family N-acetyltransferase [Streptomyces sp. McG7]MBT2905960.1 GNAT family N-acetyltransferase [Streptomyces sp. McG8]MDQ0491668.1 putative acetyltransferase [Streptomyces thermodiastaticus]MYQ34580.1 GNAT family N-acetyltransferase [Streptomyces sp. SID4956]MYW54401.1 GNAT family N-acetyltransferase [Streptomyces sp. SID8376]THC50324.1 GNAT family N-acetyltransferase [Streptomyces sp. Akac8]UVT09768.1 GNAT family N-acetyltransferase [Streptomyces thermocarboxydus]WSB41444.1 GNAT fam
MVDDRTGPEPELRSLRPDEWDSAYGNLLRAFGGLPEADEERQLWRSITEFGRFLAAWDGDRCVASGGAFSFRLTVPGGASVPTAGVTMVSVAATHRRRGLLTAMMRRQLDDIRSWGEPLAVLTASEPAIYGRFGYGAATFQLDAEIDTVRAGLTVPDGTDDVRLRYADPVEALDVCEAVYAQLVPGRPGMPARRPGWEKVGVLDPESERGGASPLQCVVAERDGATVGYARFRVKPHWGPGGPDGEVVLSALDALDPAAAAALWRFLFDLDLTSSLRVRGRPVDDSWQYLVRDVRRCRPALRDALYLRPVEVGAALAARTYRTPVDVVLEVEDAFCPWNTGRWRLSGDAKGAVCEPTRDAADLALSVRELGAAYLGGVSLTALAAAGRVRELRGGALAEASVAFGSDPAPWLPHGF